jgi:hypothetical protein
LNVCGLSDRMTGQDRKTESEERQSCRGKLEHGLQIDKGDVQERVYLYMCTVI